jgi:mannose-1-phosphate guanylyltransferase / phosphomannomutase
MKAVIMAGGFGTRIHPLTIDLPKPMIPLYNRPIMLHIIELLKKHGIDELILLLYHQPMVIKNFFGDGSEFGVRITYVTPLEDFGTAGAVKMAAKHLDERFMIISGDLLTDFDLSKAMAFHEEKQAKATITLTSVKDPLQFGVVITDKKGKITKFLEKPGWGEVFSDTINTGIYVLEPEVLDMIPEGENRDWSKDIFPQMLTSDDALFGCSLDGYWADIGNTDAYLEACRDIANGCVTINLNENPVGTGDGQLFLGDGAHLAKEEKSLIEGMVVLGDNSQILGKSRLINCVVGHNCIIEDGVELKNAILWDNVYIKKNSTVTGAVLCSNIRVGQKVVIEEGAVVAEETTIGDEVLIKKDIKIWPRKVIEGGAIFGTNLIWGEKWRKSIFEGAIVRGLTNVELTPEFAAKLGAAYGSILPKDSSVLSGRDSVRASRMLKRSFAGGLLSAGINVRDTKMISLPVLRYKLTTFGEVGGIQFRQSPEEPAATDILFYDAEGIEISSATSKNIERIFFKENFRRVHYTDPGSISEIPRIFDYYREGFLRALNAKVIADAAPKVVIDLNHSSAGELLPILLDELGCEVIELNSLVTEIRTGTPPEQEAKAMDQLSRIVVTLGATAGFWMGPSGERTRLIDENGEVLSDIEAMSVLTALVCRAEHCDSVVVPVSAPSLIELLAAEAGMLVKRTKNDPRAIVESAKDRRVQFAASMDGRFAFPCFQHNFDALFTVAKTLELLVRTGLSIGQVRKSLPKRFYEHVEVPCSLEFKGGIMRKMSEDSVDLEASFIDGVRIQLKNDWALMLPDQYRPVAHVIAESADKNRAKKLVETYRKKVEKWKQELQ